MNYQLTREERLEALGWGLLLALVTSLPYLLGYMASPAEKYFLGFVLNPADQNTYFMWMSQVASGETLLQQPVYQHSARGRRPQPGIPRGRLGRQAARFPGHRLPAAAPRRRGAACLECLAVRRHLHGVA